MSPPSFARSFAMLGLLSVSFDANAAYILGLSQSQVDDVSSHYGLTSNEKLMMEAMMTAPFDCENFGDLCALTGETRALYYLDDLWALGLSHASHSTIAASMQIALEGYEQDRFDELFPTGVPTNSPWWGGNNAPPNYFGSCSWNDDDSEIGKKEYVEYEAGTKRLQVRAWNIVAVFFNTAGGTSRTYSLNSTGGWSPHSRSQTIEVNLSHTDPYCGEYCDSKTANDTVVKLAAYTYVGMSQYRYVNAWASSGGASVAADNSIVFSETTCL
jgi:hypothetical protein